ncbi:MAG: RNA 2',3'-cyclic phosphodiesterase [Actinoplanes sp.]
MAVFPPPSETRALRLTLPPTGRLTAADKWHVTLAFLGEVAPEPVAAALSDVPPAGPFDLQLAGGGQFGSAAWAGLTGDLSALTALRSKVRDGLASGGFLPDDRPFRPHLTVSYHGDGSIRRALSAYEGKPWPVSEFALMRSSNGVYERLNAWPV